LFSDSNGLSNFLHKLHKRRCCSIWMKHGLACQIGEGENGSLMEAKIQSLHFR
jgi:hypothetical protein